LFIIYNISGLLIGFLGVVLGILSIAATGYVWVGILVVGAVWAGLGLWWRKGTAGSGKRPYPSVFFIPLPFLAILSLPLAVASMTADKASSAKLEDPRAQKLAVAKNSLRQEMLSGDTNLARTVLTEVMAGAYTSAVPNEVSVYAEPAGDAVLVIVKISNLRKFSESDKGLALNAIRKASETESVKEIYCGVMGFASFGAIQTPELRQVGKFVSDDLLLPFYGSQAPLTPAVPETVPNPP